MICLIAHATQVLDPEAEDELEALAAIFGENFRKVEREDVHEWAIRVLTPVENISSEVTMLTSYSASASRSVMSRNGETATIWLMIGKVWNVQGDFQEKNYQCPCRLLAAVQDGQWSCRD